MKDHPVLECIDRQFIKAIDVIREVYRKNNLKYLSDSGIGGIVYGSNRHIVAQVCNRERHIPHLALVAFAKHFNIEMNYFYDQDLDLEFTLDTDDPETFVSQTTKDGLSREYDTKIDDFIKHLKQKEYPINLHITTALQEFKEQLIMHLEQTPMENARKILTLALDMVFEEVKKRGEIITQSDRAKGSFSAVMGDQKITLYENLLEATKMTMAAKDSENETLKKYILRLETELQ
jgi:hypothetical protein